MTLKNTRCTLSLLESAGHITEEEMASLYFAAEVLTDHYFMSSHLNPIKTSTHKRKWYEKSARTEYEKNVFIELFFKHFKDRKTAALFDEIILKNNVSLLQSLKRKPQLMAAFKGLLKEMHLSLMDHIETMVSRSGIRFDTD